MLKCDAWLAWMRCVIEDLRNTHTPFGYIPAVGMRDLYIYNGSRWHCPLPLPCRCSDVLHAPRGGNVGGGDGDGGREENARDGELGVACYRSYCGQTK